MVMLLVAVASAATELARVIWIVGVPVTDATAATEDANLIWLVRALVAVAVALTLAAALIEVTSVLALAAATEATGAARRICVLRLAETRLETAATDAPIDPGCA